MEYVLVSCVVYNKEGLQILVFSNLESVLALIKVPLTVNELNLLLGKAPLAIVKIGLKLRLEVPISRLYFILASIAAHNILPVDVVLSELVAEGEPALSEIVVPGKQLYLLGTRDQEINKRIDLLGFLTFLPYLSHYQIVRDLGLEFDVFIGRALVPYETHFTGVQEVKSMGDVNLFVLSLNPGELVHDFVAPLVHALVAYVHLAVQNPQETKSLSRQHFHWYVHDLRIRHCGVVEIELIVREHEAGVITLRTFYSPWRVYLHHLKLSNLVN